MHLTLFNSNSELSHYQDLSQCYIDFDHCRSQFHPSILVSLDSNDPDALGNPDDCDGYGKYIEEAQWEHFVLFLQVNVPKDVV